MEKSGFSFGSGIPMAIKSTDNKVQNLLTRPVPQIAMTRPMGPKTTQGTVLPRFGHMEIKASSPHSPPEDSLPQWREVVWSEDKREELVKTISSYTSDRGKLKARVLLLGPVGSGKSSFISSVQSALNGRVTNRAMVGTSATSSFTKKLQSFNIRAPPGDDPTGLVLCDMMGMESDINRLSLHDILSVIQGHVPDGHKFTNIPVTPETPSYIKRPSLQDVVHCVAFVLDASRLGTYPKSLRATFAELREHITDLDVHQVALLTNIDKLCKETAKDTSQVYGSSFIRSMMDQAGDLLGMSTSYIVPVKNYSSELSTDLNTDILLLKAVDHILQYVELYFLDNDVRRPVSNKKEDEDTKPPFFR